MARSRRAALRAIDKLQRLDRVMTAPLGRAGMRLFALGNRHDVCRYRKSMKRRGLSLPIAIQTGRSISWKIPCRKRDPDSTRADRRLSSNVPCRGSNPRHFPALGIASRSSPRNLPRRFTTARLHGASYNFRNGRQMSRERPAVPTGRDGRRRATGRSPPPRRPAPDGGGLNGASADAPGDRIVTVSSLRASQEAAARHPSEQR